MLTSTNSPKRSFLPSRASAASAGGDDSRRRFLAAPRAIAGARLRGRVGGIGRVQCERGSLGLVSPGIRGGAQEKPMKAELRGRGR